MMGQILHMTFSMTTPILFAGIGGLFTGISGYLNIGLEGLMLLSAFFSAHIANVTGNILLGTFAGTLVSILFSLIMVLLIDRFGANLYIVGLATNLMADGLTVFTMQVLFNSKGTIMFSEIPKMRLIDPFPRGSILEIFNGYTIFDYLAILITLIVYFLLSKTRFGYNLRAIGKNREAMIMLGINVNKYIYVSFMMSGLFCGLAGASLSIPLRSFVENMTGGRGWIALVTVVVSNGNPLVLLLFSILFGFFTALSNFIQTMWKSSPLIFSIPYILTILILVAHSVGSRGSMKPNSKGDG
ncbi:MAG: ABC transporter permease [Thermotoga sp.]|nr:MAG: ABC transporter permease [Thermotoga sp.]